MDTRRGQTARRHARWRLHATARRRVVWRQREVDQAMQFGPKPARHHAPATRETEEEA